MNCYVCNMVVDREDVCPVCGADVRAYRHIIRACDEAYNDGLRRAKMRDLSGAIESLNRALRFNKRHIDARNLLGLVYYEFGEPVLGMREWVISKNFSPKNNRAELYLEKIAHGSGALKQLNQTVKKYNQAIEYCQQGNRDLAKIQLKKVITMNPKMVRARQLLALLHMQDNEWEAARKELHAAGKIDMSNPRTIEYMQEVKSVLSHESEKKKKKKASKPVTVDFRDVNEAAVMPRQTLVETLDNMKGGIFNILIGGIIGLLVTVFLVVPTVRQNANSTAANALVSANEEAAGHASDIVALNAQIDDLTKRLDKYEGQADVKDSYEQLMRALSLMNAEEPDARLAQNELSKVNKKLLESEGKSTYSALSMIVEGALADQIFEEGEEAFKKDDFPAAIEAYKQVVKMDKTYGDGQALFNLARSYQLSEDYVMAVKYFNKVTELFPDARIAGQARYRLGQIPEEYKVEKTEEEEEQ